jgi:hypothetical protein
MDPIIYKVVRLIEELSEFHPSQASLSSQLWDLQLIATKLKLYDAADAIQKLLER